MTLRWALLIAATAALLVPLPAFYSRKRRFRDLHQLDIERRNGSRWLMLKQVLRFSGHWIDLARGLLASACMLATIDELRAVSALYAEHAAWARYVLPLTLAIICVILIGLLFRYPGKSLAPIPFVTAAVVVLVPPAVAVPSLLFGLFCAAKLRSLALFFAISAPMMAVLGLLLDRQLWPSIAGAVLTAVPAIIAFARHRELVIPVRRSHTS